MNSKILNQEIYERCVNSPDFAYWVGVVQSDGYFKVQHVQSINRKRYFVVLGVGKKSLSMQDKFRNITQKIFGLKGCLFKLTDKKGFLRYDYKFGCKNLLKLFCKLKIDFKQVHPPDWILKNSALFGSYLAGVIDGDGDVRIKRPKYPQCCIRVHSRRRLFKLEESIKNFLKCGVSSITREKQNVFVGNTFNSRGCVTEFSLSSKNITFFREFVIRYIAINHKKELLERYIMKRRVATGI